MSVTSIRTAALEHLATKRLANATDGNGKAWLSIEGHEPNRVAAYKHTRSGRFEIRLTPRANREFYEEVTTLLFSHILTEFQPRTVFDIGAASGYFALVAASHVDAYPDVHCFEMKPHQVRRIEQNAKAASLPGRIFAHLAGLSDSHVGMKGVWFVKNMLFESEPSPEEYREAWYIRLKFTLQGGGGDYRRLQSTDVLLTTIDHFCATKGLAPDLLKIDVDGYEGKILAGAQSVLRQHQPIILLEIHSNDMMRDGFTRRDIVQNMSDAGYRFLFITDHHRKEACDLIEIEPSDSLLARDALGMILCIPPRLLEKAAA